jgi:chromosome segregation ATPase
MALNNSQVLGVLKRMRDDNEALIHARGVIEAYMQAQETLINLDSMKAVKQGEITELEQRRQTEVDNWQKDRFEHKREMDGLQRERGVLRAEVENLKGEVARIRDSVDVAVSEKQNALTEYEHKISDQEKILQALKDEIEAIRKRFAA